MGRFSSIIDNAPLPLRLVPALLGGSLVLVTVGRSDLAAPLAGLAALAGLAGLLGPRGRDEISLVEGEEVCLTVEAPIVPLGRIDSLLGERSKETSLSYLVLSEYVKNIHKIIIIIKGREAVEEAERLRLLLRSIAPEARVTRALCPTSYKLEEMKYNDNNVNLEKNYIVIGRFVEGNGEPVALTPEDVERHIGVFGSTGSGKSTTLRVIASRAPHEVRVVVLDWTGEHSDTLAKGAFKRAVPGAGVGLDVVACRGLPREVVLEILVRALDLSEPQAYLLSLLIEKGAASLVELYRLLSGAPEESKWDREVKRALQRKLGTLLRSAGGRMGGCPDWSSLPSRLVIDASVIPDVHARRSVINIILASLLIKLINNTINDKVLAIVDEAHNVVRKDSNDILNMALAESRKYGLYLAYATQSPSLIGDLALLNTNTKIVHSLRSQRDKRVIMDAMGLGETWAMRLDKLPRGVALLQSPSHPEPVLIKIDA